MRNNCAAVLLVFALSGCSSSPPVNFYTLEQPETSTAAAATAFPHSVAVGPVSIPESVNRSQLVVRITPNRVDVLEEEQWAEPLKSGIAQVVVACLSADLAGASVAPLAQSAASTTEYRVSIDVQRFESLPGKAAIIDARWSIKRTASEMAPVTDTTHVRESVQGEGYAALVAAHSRALATLSRAIAAALIAAQGEK